MNEVKKFMETLENDPKARELAENISIPYDEEKALDLYIDLAKKLGYTISREDLRNWEQEQEKEYKAKSEKAQDGMVESLNLDQMNMVAGGRRDTCMDTYKRGEWCWLTDSCKMIIRRYDLMD